MSTIPILLSQPRVLLVGGGCVGLHKARVLSSNRIHFEVVAERLHEGFGELACVKRLKPFEAADILGFDTVIDATGNRGVREALLVLKEKRPFLLNVVDVPEHCDFYFSSLIQRGLIKVAVSSDGASPTMTQVIRNEIDAMLPEPLGALSQLKAKERALRRIDIADSKKATGELFNRVQLVGCGLGDVELLTLKAYRAIERAEVVLYDHLVTPETVALADEKAERICVGKKKGCHSFSQEEINALIVSRFRAGKRVVRLKSGDPFIFGRGAEEALCLKREGIPFEVVPGISSAVSAPMLAGIPLTARGYSAGFSVVSAHLKNNRINLEWIDLLGKPNHTVVVLMGLSLAERIAEAARCAGVGAESNVAIVANASRREQQVIFTTLEKLANEAKNAASPAVLVFGGGVDFVKATDFSPFFPVAVAPAA